MNSKGQAKLEDVATSLRAPVLRLLRPGGHGSGKHTLRSNGHRAEALMVWRVTPRAARGLETSSEIRTQLRLLNNKFTLFVS